MRAFATVFSLLTFTGAFAQVSRLEVHNPGPRLNDDIEVQVTLQKKGGSADDADKDETVVRDAQLGRGNLILRQVASDTGTLVIGPFSFNVAGQTYTTDKISIKVYPPLPDKIRDGMWSRVIQFNGESYLIIEQRISVKWKKEQSGNEQRMTLDTDGVTFASLDEDKFEEAGLNIISSSSRSETQNLDKNEPFGSGSVSYKRSTYKFKKKDTFKSKFKLDKKFFIDFPGKVHIDEVWIE